MRSEFTPATLCSFVIFFLHATTVQAQANIETEKTASLSPVVLEFSVSDTDNGWLKSATAGFLAIDINHNRKIDNGSELFGKSSYSKDGKTFKNGYEALAQYDRNRDHTIDRKDIIFGRLRVWFDANSNGTTDDGELKTLKAAGITSIAVSSESN